MKKTIIVIIVIAVAILFYWQFFVPQASPTDGIQLRMEEGAPEGGQY